MYLWDHFMNMHFYLFLLRGFHRPPELCLSPSPALSLTSASRLTTQKHLWGQNRDVVSSEYNVTWHKTCMNADCMSVIPQSILDLHNGFSISSLELNAKQKMLLVFVREWMNEFTASGDLSSWASKMKDLEPHTGNMWCSSRVYLTSSSQNALLPIWIKTNTYSTYTIDLYHLKQLESKTFYFILFPIHFSVYSKFCFIVTFRLPLSLVPAFFFLLAAMVWCREAWPQEGVERHKWGNASFILTFMKRSVTSTMNVSMLELWHNKHSWIYTADYTQRGSGVWSYHRSVPQLNFG